MSEARASLPRSVTDPSGDSIYTTPPPDGPSLNPDVNAALARLRAGAPDATPAAALSVPGLGVGPGASRSGFAIPAGRPAPPPVDPTFSAGGLVAPRPAAARAEPIPLATPQPAQPIPPAGGAPAAPMAPPTPPKGSFVTPSAQGGVATGQVISFEPSSALQQVGFSSDQWATYRGVLAQIESSSYAQPPNASGHMGRYQMGRAEIDAAAHDLGIAPPTDKEFLVNPHLQEELYQQYTISNDKLLRTGTEPEFADLRAVYAKADPATRMAMLAGMHFAGPRGMTAWLHGSDPEDANHTKVSTFLNATYKALTGGAGLERTGLPIPTAQLSPAAQGAIAANNETIKALTAQLAETLKKMNETSPADAEYAQALRHHREVSERLEEAYLKESSQAPQRTQQDVMGQLGSLAMLAAVFGGFAARVPAVASLNAAGAAMEAMNSNNERDYRDRIEAWKTHLDAMSRGMTFENEQIRSILEEKGLSVRERHEKLEERFRALGMFESIGKLQAGNYEEIGKDLERQQKIAHEAAETAKIWHEMEEDRGWSPELRGKDELTREARAQLLAKHDRDVAAYDAAVKQAAAEGKPPPSDPPLSLDQAKQDHGEVVKAMEAAHAARRKETPHTDIPELGNTKEERQAALVIGEDAANAGQSVEEYLGAPGSGERDGKIRAARKQAVDELARAGHPYSELKVRQEADRVVAQLDEGDRLVELIKQTYFGVGLGGRLTRPIEVLGNILQLTDETKRSEIRSAIETMKMTAYRALTGTARTNVRDTERLDAIIKGLEMGSTTQNTIASIRAFQAYVVEANASLLKDQGIPANWARPDDELPVVGPGTPGMPGSPAQLPPGGDAVPDWQKFSQPVVPH